MLTDMLSIAQRAAVWVGCVLLLLPALGALAESDMSDKSHESAEPIAAAAASDARPDEPTIDLDQLLKLPDSYLAEGERRGGANRNEWRARFFAAREDLDKRKEDLERLQTKMEGMAVDSSTWAAGAPGLSNPDPGTQTLSYKLRQDIRRAREEIKQSERDLRDLQVEADLAAVPDSWRE